MELASPGFSIYLTIGWPTPRVFKKILSMTKDCIDFIELGVPSKHPLYDGPVIRYTHRMAVNNGLDMESAMGLVEESEPGVQVILMAYLGEYINEIESLLDNAERIGVASILFPDLPFEYPDMIDWYVNEVRRRGMEPALFASSKFPHHVISRYRMYRPLLVYLGLQPATGIRLPARVLDNIRLARSLLGDVYMLAGFSIRSSVDALKVLMAGASGVVVGSHLVRVYNKWGLDAVVEEACRIREGVERLGRDTSVLV